MLRNLLLLVVCIPTFPTYHDNAIQITQEDVNKYRPHRLSIPKCEIRLKWMGVECQPQELLFPLNLIGAMEPQNRINVLFEPPITTSETDSSKHQLFVQILLVQGSTW